MEYTEELMSAIEEALQDKDFVSKLTEAQDKEQFKALFLERGIEIDDVLANSAIERLDYLKTGGELTVEELEMVSGGKKTAFKGWLFTMLCASIGGAVAGPPGVVAGALIGTYLYMKF